MKEERRGKSGRSAGGGGGGGDGGDSDGGQRRRRGESEPEMAVRWLLLLLALLAAHAAALPDFIRIGEYLSSGFHRPVKAANHVSTALNGASKIIINVPADNIPASGGDGSPIHPYPG